MADSGNIFEKSARTEKVRRLTIAIDARARASGIDPIAQGARLAAMIEEQFIPRTWNELAKEADCEPPHSTATVREIAAFYRERADAAARALVAGEGLLSDPLRDLPALRSCG